MELLSLLEQHRDAILDRWFDRIARTYPPLTSEFLTQQQDPFQNPVGHAIREGVRPIYDQLVAGMDHAEIERALDGIIRIRSVQEFTPSQVVAFVFELKKVVRGVLNGESRSAGTWQALADLDSRIDSVALLAFDKYTQCREQLHEIRHKEVARRSIHRKPSASECLDCSECEEEAIDDDV